MRPQHHDSPSLRTNLEPYSWRDCSSTGARGHCHLVTKFGRSIMAKNGFIAAIAATVEYTKDTDAQPLEQPRSGLAHVDDLLRRNRQKTRPQHLHPLSGTSMTADMLAILSLWDGADDGVIVADEDGGSSFRSFNSATAASLVESAALLERRVDESPKPTVLHTTLARPVATVPEAL